MAHDPAHVLSVTRAADDECDAEYELMCNQPGATSCQVWRECETCRDDDTAMNRYLDGVDARLHGSEHSRIDGMLMTPGRGCVLSNLDCIFNFDVDTLAAGEYPIEFDCDCGGVYVSLIAGA